MNVVPWLRLWGWPITIGVLAATALVAALLTDSAWDLLWSAALAVSLAVAAWFIARRSSSRAREPRRAAKDVRTVLCVAVVLIIVELIGHPRMHGRCVVSAGEARFACEREVLLADRAARRPV